ncbi:MAG TPA: O-acetyl-ADP-ribose deacetylase [Candidatus Omnitrophota bacterium]|nr:O-acetyl-ADP-ribose deacetylase [Candidatus Omnitrophota bacterium]
MIILKQGDITEEDVAVIVNAANSGLRGGGGVDGAIHRAAGPAVMEECQKIGHCATGEAVMTQAGNLKAKKIVHTVGPVWYGGNRHEPELLRSAYRNSFILARNGCFRTIAFPAISTGIYGYPKKEGARIAIKTGIEFERDFEEIRYICFSAEDLKIYQDIFKKERAT